jgi:hypothetical protein
MYTMRYSNRKGGWVIERGYGSDRQIHSVHINEEDAREELRTVNVQSDMEPLAFRRIERLMSDLQKQSADHGLGPISDDRIAQVVKVTADIIHNQYAEDDPYNRQLRAIIGQFDSR